MNVRLGDYVATQGNDNEKRIQFREQVGMLSSSLESAIPEQMFVGNGVWVTGSGLAFCPS
jgi:hypothetical protein